MTTAEPTDGEGAARRVLVSGASGLIGTEVLRQLRADGQRVLTLVRRSPAGPDERQWSPGAALDPGIMDEVDAVINLSGASLGRIPWTASYKRTILQSRIETTTTIAEAIAAASAPPTTLLNASAVGIYGDRGADPLPDGAPRGDGFLADVVEAWELASQLAAPHTRVVDLRTGIVVGNGGALKPLLLVTRLGAGSRIGDGQQYWPWISLHDEAAAIRHLLGSDVTGPVNLAGPEPATAERITRYLATRLRRPHLFVLPKTVISLGMGEMGRELLLTSQRVVPTTLGIDGFQFRHTTVEQAVDALLAS